MRTSSILWVEYPQRHAGNPEREADPERVAATWCDTLGVRRVGGLGDTPVFGTVVPFAHPGAPMPNLTPDRAPPDPASPGEVTRVTASILGWKDERRAIGVVVAVAGAALISWLT